MIVCKALGALFLVLSAFEAARTLSRTYELEILTIEGYIELIRQVRTEVDIYALPIDEILKRCDGELLLRCGKEEDKTPEDLISLFSGAGGKRIKDKVAYKEIFEFCSDFGHNYREEELKRCDASIAMLEARRDVLRGDVHNKKKMSYTLALSAAAALVILLI